MTYSWNTNIRYVKGVGPVKAQELEKIKIKTIGDLLEYKPLDYVYPGVTSISDLPNDGYAVVKGKIEQIWRAQNNTPVVYAKISDETGTCLAIWWNQVYIVQHLHVGMAVTFWGKCKAGKLQQPKFSTLGFKADEVIGGMGKAFVHGSFWAEKVDDPCATPSTMVTITAVVEEHNEPLQVVAESLREAVEALAESVRESVSRAGPAGAAGK